MALPRNRHLLCLVAAVVLTAAAALPAVQAGISMCTAVEPMCPWRPDALPGTKSAATGPGSAPQMPRPAARRQLLDAGGDDAPPRRVALFEEEETVNTPALSSDEGARVLRRLAKALREQECEAAGAGSECDAAASTASGATTRADGPAAHGAARQLLEADRVDAAGGLFPEGIDLWGGLVKGALDAAKGAAPHAGGDVGSGSATSGGKGPAGTPTPTPAPAPAPAAMPTPAAALLPPPGCAPGFGLPGLPWPPPGLPSPILRVLDEGLGVVAPINHVGVPNQRGQPQGQLLQDLTWLDNGNLTVGIDVHRGGVVGQISSRRMPPPFTGVNLVNAWDCGRLMQQSYYGCTDGSCWASKAWRWNPVQCGSWQNRPAHLLSSRVERAPSSGTGGGGAAARVLTEAVPRNWGGQELLDDVTLTSDYSLLPDALNVTYGLRYGGSSAQPALAQEVPAFFADRRLGVLVLYEGSKPWTNDKLRFTMPGARNDYFQPTERWAAYIDPATGAGIGVFVPIATGLTAYRVGPDNSTRVSDTSYFALTTRFPISPNSTFSYRAYVTAGRLGDMRRTFRRLAAAEGLAAPEVEPAATPAAGGAKAASAAKAAGGQAAAPALAPAPAALSVVAERGTSSAAPAPAAAQAEASAAPKVVAPAAATPQGPSSAVKAAAFDLSGQPHARHHHMRHAPRSDERPAAKHAHGRPRLRKHARGSHTASKHGAAAAASAAALRPKAPAAAVAAAAPAAVPRPSRI